MPLSVARDYINIVPAKKTPSEKIKIGMVARWDRIKNHQAFLEIAKLAEQKNLPLEFVSVTTIPQTDLNKEIKKEYQRLIEIINPMPVKELIKFYEDIDVLLCPSHFDVSPTVVFESLLCGTPVLISENTGQKNLFQKFGIGDWVSDFFDPEESIRKIQQIKLEQIPQNLIAHLKNNHSDKAVFNKYLEIIKSAAKIPAAQLR